MFWFQESLLSLGAAMTASEFRNAVCEGLHATLSHVVRTLTVSHKNEECC